MVKKIVAAIQKNDRICPQSFMVLVLKMQVLTESLELEIEQEGTERKPIAQKRGHKRTSGKPQYIDGRRLSKREVDFEEFVNGRFDSETWLKKNGLIL